MRTRVLEVQDVERLSGQLVRIVFGGDLEGFGAGQHTDHYVKIQFPPPGAPYDAPFDPQVVKAELPKAQWPRTRTYTVRHFDADRLRLTIDFVVHGDDGVAGPWALAARPGDRLQLRGPGGGYAPRPDADWHLLVGDASALPAIGAALERIGEHAVVHVVLAADEIRLPGPAGSVVHWVRSLPAAVAALPFPDGVPQVFVHGEASDVREVRRLLVERGVALDGQSVSGYWKRDLDDEAWRAAKAARSPSP